MASPRHPSTTTRQGRPPVRLSVPDVISRAAFVGCHAASRRLRRPALLMLAALFVVACDPPPDVQRIDLPLPEGADISERPAGRYGGVFVESNAQEPKTFNPMVSEDAYSAEAIGLMQSSLT